MNIQNEHRADLVPDQEPDQNKGKKPSLFSIIFCFIVSTICFTLSLLGIIGNMRMKTPNTTYGIASSAEQTAYDIGVWIGKNLPIMIGIVIGIVFLRAAMKDLQKRKEGEDK